MKSRMRSLLVVATFAATVLIGVAPVNASAGSSGGGASAQLDARRATLRQLLQNPAAAPRVVSSPRTNANCSVLMTQVPSGNITTFNELEAVAPIFPTDAWAVGLTNTGVTNAVDHNLVAHWNGTSWTATALANLGNGHNDLVGVAANDPNDVWAVGNSENGSVFHTLAYHYNGVGWSVVGTPQPSTFGQALAGVSALSSSNVWAVGLFINGSGVGQTLAINWNGSAWVAVSTPGLGATTTSVLENVTALAANNVWAVGYSQAPAATKQTLVEHYDGVSWSIVTSVDPAAGDNVLFNVSGSGASDVWAVGYDTAGSSAPRQTLIEHWTGSAWAQVAGPPLIATGDSQLIGVVATSTTNAWTVGFSRTTPSAASTVIAAHWDGTSWTQRTSDNPGAGDNVLVGVASLPGNDVFAVGGALPTGNTSESTLVVQFQLPAPTNVVAAPGDLSASVTFTNPACDGGFTATSYLVTAFDGCAIQQTASGAASPITLLGVTNGTELRVVVQAQSASLGAETPSAPSAFFTPTGTTPPVNVTACTTQQYQFPSPSSNTFTDIDSTHLSVSITPNASSVAVITGNADLWTANSGLNQDIGIFVSGGTFGTGQIVGWKESGGFAGTFSPNAAAVQAVVSLSASTPYTVKLQWKANKAAPGASIFAGAGPVEGDRRFSAWPLGYSPTRLNVHLVPVTPATEFSVVSTSQYHLKGSNGSTWQDIDSTNLSESVPVASPMTAVISGNADLFTGNAGFNQDIGINVDGVIASWKESGGFAGTFSPNAAFVQAVIPLNSTGSPHTVKLQWKTNKNAPGATIYAGAGPLPTTTSFSPTRLTVILLPTADVTTGVGTTQYNLANSDGAGWTPIDSTNLKFAFIPGVTFYTYDFTANADLWTANAGFNQDIGIFISGGQYGSGTLVAWKESGGFAGTFSPNAAYVDAVQHLNSGVSYTVWVAWKTNKPGGGSTIFAAAGSAGNFSPTRLTAFELGSP